MSESDPYVATVDTWAADGRAFDCRQCSSYDHCCDRRVPRGGSRCKRLLQRGAHKMAVRVAGTAVTKFDFISQP